MECVGLWSDFVAVRVGYVLLGVVTTFAGLLFIAGGEDEDA